MIHFAMDMSFPLLNKPQIITPNHGFGFSFQFSFSSLYICRTGLSLFEILGKFEMRKYNRRHCKFVDVVYIKIFCKDPPILQAPLGEALVYSLIVYMFLRLCRYWAAAGQHD